MTYKFTPLASGYLPAELMFGITFPLGLPIVACVDYDKHKAASREYSELARKWWNDKHNAKPLSELKNGT